MSIIIRFFVFENGGTPPSAMSVVFSHILIIILQSIKLVGSNVALSMRLNADVDAVVPKFAVEKEREPGRDIIARLANREMDCRITIGNQLFTINVCLFIFLSLLLIKTRRNAETLFLVSISFVHKPL